MVKAKTNKDFVLTLSKRYIDTESHKMTIQQIKRLGIINSAISQFDFIDDNNHSMIINCLRAILMEEIDAGKFERFNEHILHFYRLESQR